MDWWPKKISQLFNDENLIHQDLPCHCASHHEACCEANLRPVQSHGGRHPAGDGHVGGVRPMSSNGKSCLWLRMASVFWETQHFQGICFRTFPGGLIVFNAIWGYEIYNAVGTGQWTQQQFVTKAVKPTAMHKSRMASSFLLWRIWENTEFTWHR